MAVLYTANIFTHCTSVWPRCHWSMRWTLTNINNGHQYDATWVRLDGIDRCSLGSHRPTLRTYSKLRVRVDSLCVLSLTLSLSLSLSLSISHSLSLSLSLSLYSLSLSLSLYYSLSLSLSLGRHWQMFTLVPCTKPMYLEFCDLILLVSSLSLPLLSLPPSLSLFLSLFLSLSLSLFLSLSLPLSWGLYRESIRSHFPVLSHPLSLSVYQAWLDGAEVSASGWGSGGPRF